MKKAVIILVLFFNYWGVNSQIANSAGQAVPPKLIPPSPEVGSITKFTEMPMNMVNGTPVISIPIYTIQNKDIQIPISLSYNASGIRVEEASTWVGLGWNLSTGGSITRSVRGMPDEKCYMNPQYTIDDIHNAVLLEGSHILAPFDVSTLLKTQVNENSYDILADIFSFNILGYSGKFCWNQHTQSFIQLPLSNVKIDYTLSATEGIRSFILTLPNGIKAYFGLSKDGNRHSVEDTYPIKNITNYNNDQNNVETVSQTFNTGSHANTSWSILTIENKDGSLIQFNYSNVLSRNFGRLSESSVPVTIAGNMTNYSYSYHSASFFEQDISKPIISSITTNNCSIHFDLTGVVREDVYSLSNEQALNQIRVLDYSGNLVKKIQFSYNYSVSTDQPELPGLLDYTQIARKRLVLTSLYETGINGESNPPYLFTYSNKKLPSRFSSAQDYWGYYNGKPNTYNGWFLIPKIDAIAIPQRSTGFIGTNINEITGTDRTIDPDLSYSGILTKITYPTRGSSEYFYESNEGCPIADETINYLPMSGLTPRELNFWGMVYAPPLTNPLTDEQYFTVNNAIGYISFISNFENCLTNQSSNCGIKIKIKGITNPLFEQIIDYSGIGKLRLPKGSYKIIRTISSSLEAQLGHFPEASIKLEWKEMPDNFSYLVGGLRVYKIINTDNFGNNLIKRYAYKLFDFPEVSSGFPPANPTFVFEGWDYDQGNKTGFRKFLSNSTLPLLNDGGVIFYKNVTEFYDENNTSFKTEYAFNFDLDQLMEGPRKLTTKKNWRNGQLKQKNVYEKLSNSTYRIISKEENEFDFDSEIEYRYCLEFTLEPLNLANFKSYNPDNYLKTEWFHPVSNKKTAYSYDLNGNQKSSVLLSTFEYNSKHLLSRTITQNSIGDVIENNTYYPNDYNLSVVGNLQDLVDNNLIQLPIRQDKLVKGKVVNSLVNQYNSRGLLTDVHQFENSIPTKITHSDILYIPNSALYKHKLYLYNDNFGNVQIAQKTNDLSEIYLYGYNHQYPVAKIVGSSLNTVQSTITQSILDNPTDDAALRTELTKLRGIAGALVTTYTYKPLVGVTSETDPQGKTIYYEYDNFNRLKLIRDKDNNILKTFDYKYQLQVN